MTKMAFKPSNLLTWKSRSTIFYLSIHMPLFPNFVSKFKSWTFPILADQTVSFASKYKLTSNNIKTIQDLISLGHGHGQHHHPESLDIFWLQIRLLEISNFLIQTIWWDWQRVPTLITDWPSQIISTRYLCVRKQPWLLMNSCLRCRQEGSWNRVGCWKFSSNFKRILLLLSVPV